MSRPGAVRTSKRTSLGFPIAAQFMISLDATIAYVLVPDIQRSLAISTTELAWVLNGYLIVFAGFQLVGGRLGDVFGARRVLLVGLTLFIIASAACGLAGSAPMLIASRAVQGLGAALLGPSAMSLLLVRGDDERRRGLGWWSAMSGLAGGLGLVAGGLFALASWRWAFLVNVPIGLGLLWIARRDWRPRGEVQRTPVDLPAAVLSTVAVMAAVLGLLRAGERDYGEAAACIGVALVLSALFLAQERRVVHPLVPLAVAARLEVIAGNALAAAAGAVGQATYFALMLFLQRVHGLDPLVAGVAFLPISAMLLAMSLVAPRLMRRLAPARVLSLGLFVTALGACGLAMVPASRGFVVAFLLASLVWGVGYGLAQASAFVAATSSVGPRLGGLISGLANASYRAGAAFGVALVAVLAAGAAPGGAAVSQEGLSEALVAVGGLSMIAAGGASWLVRAGGRDRADTSFGADHGEPEPARNSDVIATARGA